MDLSCAGFDDGYDYGGYGYGSGGATALAGAITALAAMALEGADLEAAMVSAEAAEASIISHRAADEYSPSLPDSDLATIVQISIADLKPAIWAYRIGVAFLAFECRGRCRRAINRNSCPNSGG